MKKVISIVGASLLATAMGIDVRDYRHRRAVWDDQVKNHGCVVFTYWNDGHEHRGDLCRLPDGTILRHAD